MAKRARKCCPIQSDTVVVGIDAAKFTSVAVAAHGDGSEGKPKKFNNDAAGYESLVAYAERLVEESGASGYVAAIEPSGHYSEPQVRWLQSRGIETYLVPPLFTSRMKDVYDGSRRKTDAKDAGVIADLCRQGRTKQWRLPKGPYAELRCLSQKRRDVVKRKNRVVNRLHAALDVVFPELPRLFSKLTGATCRWAMRHVPTPEQVLAVDQDELVACLKKASRGQLGRKRAMEMVSAAGRSVGVKEGMESRRLCIELLVDELDQVLAQLDRVEAAMERQLECVPYAARLLSIPQIAVVTAATLVGEFGDLRNYRVADQLVSMAGLDLVENSSGERQGNRQISRRGRSYARHTLYMASLRLSGGALSKPYRRMVDVNKTKPIKAIVANMARLLRIMHALVRDDVDFDSSRTETSAAKENATEEGGAAA